MKRFILVFLSIIPSILSAQVSVTFSVDMTSASEFNPVIHQVYMSGANENGTSGIGSIVIWPIPGSEPGFMLTESSQSGVYSLTLSGIVPDTYAYKYFLVENNNPTWNLGEWSGAPNRLVAVGSSDVTVNNTWGQLFDGSDAEIVINEIMASNSNTIQDEDGDFEDWIELYNIGPGAMSLEGFGLTDSESDLRKWIFPDVTVFPGQYLIVWASGKDRAQPGSPLHTNFRISAGGEPIILSNTGEEIMDLIPSVEHRTDISYGRLPDTGENLKYLTIPTPGWANTGPGYDLFLQPLSFSHPDGFYPSPFNLTITSSDPGTTIRYTLDGSEPTPSSTLFQSEIQVSGRSGQPNIISMIPTNNNPEHGPPFFEGWQAPDGDVYKINVVRAKAFHNNAPDAETYTYNYLVDPEAESRYSLPVFSLNTNPENLFDDNIGIYVPGNDSDNPNFFQDGWERPANLTLFESGAVLAFKEDIGIRLNGNTTRSRPRKSFRILAKGEYGNSWINYQLFPDKETDRYKRFILRNSGNDWDFTVFRDGLFQYLAKDMHLETQYYRPAILFLNGEYWGIHNIRDKYDHRYFRAKYEIAEEDITILGDNSVFRWGVEEGKINYDNMYSFVAGNSMQTAANYSQLNEMIDIESFIDYQLIHIFVKNTDWPGNNALYWRYNRDGYAQGQGVRDGRWRWMILDTDFGFDLPFFYVPGLDEGPAHNTLNFATDPSGPDWPNPPWSTLMLRKLLENNEFRTSFINRYCDLLNTTFSSSHVVSMIDSVSNILAPEMLEHIRRWRRPTTFEEWNYNVDILREFATARPEFQRQHMREKFTLQAPATLTVNISGHSHGYVRVNTIDVKGSTMGISNNPFPWSGIYFSGVPIELEAIPLPGYSFSHWSGATSGSDKIISVNMTGNTQITANFVATNEELLIHYWFFGTDVPNDTPLEFLDATYSLLPGAKIEFHSALAGYPFDDAHLNWRKASMERRNSPTEINYKPQGNNNIPYVDANMRALQIRQPFTGDGGENTIYFAVPSNGFRDIQFQFAAMDEGAANNLVIDYSETTAESWTTDGLSTSIYPLAQNYQLYTIDFSGVNTVFNNPDFIIRMRFSGTDMTADAGNRVTFNNFSITGKIAANIPDHTTSQEGLILYPIPADNLINIVGSTKIQNIGIYDISGRLILSSTESTINVSGLQKGVYIVKVIGTEGNAQTGKFVKK